jgi:hypothetical protein
MTLVNVVLHVPLVHYFYISNREDLSLSKLEDRVGYIDPPQHLQRIFGQRPTTKRLWLDQLDDDWIHDFSPFPKIVALRFTKVKLVDYSIYFLLLFEKQTYLDLEVFIQNCDSRFFTFKNIKETAAKEIPSLRLYGDETSEHSLQYPFRYPLSDMQKKQTVRFIPLSFYIAHTNILPYFRRSDPKRAE